MTSTSRMLVVLAAVAMSASLVTADALAAKSHAFTATYTGTGSGSVTGTTASGSGSATGSGPSIGHGTLTGSATGAFTSQTCVLFNGTAQLKGTAGTITISAKRGRACVGGSDANAVSFSGKATVSHGTSTFAGAHGTLTYSGNFSEQTGVVTIAFKGRITY